MPARKVREGWPSHWAACQEADGLRIDGLVSQRETVKTIQSEHSLRGSWGLGYNGLVILITLTGEIWVFGLWGCDAEAIANLTRMLCPKGKRADRALNLLDELPFVSAKHKENRRADPGWQRRKDRETVSV